MAADNDAEALYDNIAGRLKEWAKEHGLNSAVLTKFCVVARADGFNAEGQDISQVMIIPWGSHEDMLGILRNAQLRFEAEIVEGLRS